MPKVKVLYEWGVRKTKLSAKSFKNDYQLVEGTKNLYQRVVDAEKEKE